MLEKEVIYYVEVFGGHWYAHKDPHDGLLLFDSPEKAIEVVSREYCAGMKLRVVGFKRFYVSDTFVCTEEE